MAILKFLEKPVFVGGEQDNNNEIKVYLIKPKL